MSIFPFQSNAHHTRNIRRACTERRSNELQKHMGVDHIPCLHHAKSSEARLDQLTANEEHLVQKHQHLTHQQSKSENSVAKLTKSPSSENIVTAFSRPEAWNLTFGSHDGSSNLLKFDSLTISSTGLRQSIVDALQSFGSTLN